MDPHYNHLITLNNQSQFEMINVIGLPRANGTALAIALTQEPKVTGLLNEPMFYPDLKGRSWDYRPQEKALRTFDEGCKWILDRVKEEDGQKKVRLVVHDLAQDLSDTEFRDYSRVSQHVVLVIREPSMHALSMFTRYVNDQVSQGGGNKLSSEECLDMMLDDTSFKRFTVAHPKKISKELLEKLCGGELTDEELKTARQKVLNIFLREFTICWKNMAKFYQVAKKELTSSHYSIFDSKNLFENPEKALQTLSGRITDFTYTPDMVHSWKKGTGDQFRCIITKNWGDFAKINAWNGPARNSTCLKKQSGSIEKPIELTHFPQEVRQAIEDQNSIYQEMTKA